MEVGLAMMGGASKDGGGASEDGGVVREKAHSS